MDGSMWYANGGGGIFEHVDGPFAGPNPDPVIVAEGFGGVTGVSGDGWPIMPGLAGFGADDATITPAVFTPADQTKIAADTAAAIALLAQDAKQPDSNAAKLLKATKPARSYAWAWWVGGGVLALAIGSVIVAARRRP